MIGAAAGLHFPAWRRAPRRSVVGGPGGSVAFTHDSPAAEVDCILVMTDIRVFTHDAISPLVEFTPTVCAEQAFTHDATEEAVFFVSNSVNQVFTHDAPEMAVSWKEYVDEPQAPPVTPPIVPELVLTFDLSQMQATAGAVPTILSDYYGRGKAGTTHYFYAKAPKPEGLFSVGQFQFSSLKHTDITPGGFDGYSYSSWDYAPSDGHDMHPLGFMFTPARWRVGRGTSMNCVNLTGAVRVRNASGEMLTFPVEAPTVGDAQRWAEFLDDSLTAAAHIVESSTPGQYAYYGVGRPDGYFEPRPEGAYTALMLDYNVGAAPMLTPSSVLRITAAGVTIDVPLATATAQSVEEALNAIPGMASFGTVRVQDLTVCRERMSKTMEYPREFAHPVFVKHPPVKRTFTITPDYSIRFQFTVETP